MSLMLITPKTDSKTRMYLGHPMYTISGINNFCSGVLLSGIGCSTVTYSTKKAWDSDPVAMPFKRFKTMKEWVDYYKGNIYGLPKLYLWWYLMEVVLTKTEKGIGGLSSGDYRCYAGNSYATKTWFMADKKAEGEGFTTMKFMEFVEGLGVQKAGRIVMSPWADGAHGGQCRGAVWTPNVKSIKEQRNRYLFNMNAHAEYCAKHLRTADEPLPEDKVCNHW